MIKESISFFWYRLSSMSPLRYFSRLKIICSFSMGTFFAFAIANERSSCAMSASTSIKRVFVVGVKIPASIADMILRCAFLLSAMLCSSRPTSESLRACCWNLTALSAIHSITSSWRTTFIVSSATFFSIQSRRTVSFLQVCFFLRVWQA